MRRLLSILGTISLGFVVLGGLVFSYLAYQGRGLDEASKAYVETNIPRVLSTWSTEETLKLSCGQSRVGREQLELLFKKFAPLGAFRGLDDVKGQARIFVSVGGVSNKTAQYTATGKFAKGDGAIVVALAMESDEWCLLGFHLNSPLLVE